jgi:hypothetical protein
MNKKGKLVTSSPRKSPRFIQKESPEEEEDFFIVDEETDFGQMNVKPSADDIPESENYENEDDIHLSTQAEDEIEDRVNSAFNEVKSYQSLSDRFRKELENYVGDLESKVSSDGDKLIHIPKNFNTIVNAMTREDLFEGNEENEEQIEKEQKQQSSMKSEGGPQLPPRPVPMKTDPASSSQLKSKKYQDYMKMKKENKKSWFRYLMQDYIDEDMNKQFDGRYQGVLQNETAPGKSQATAVQDEKVQKGLAEIMLLDRELFALTKRAGSLALSVTPRTMASEGGSDAGLGTPNTLGSRGGYDKTFLTVKRTGSSAAQSPMATSRSVLGNQKRKNEGFKGEDEELNEEEDEDVDEEGKEKGWFPTRLDQLTDKQAKRLEELLSVEDGDEKDDDLLPSSSSYYTADDLAVLQSIDDQLESFGRLDRLKNNNNSFLENEEKKYGNSTKKALEGNDFLRLQVSAISQCFPFSEINSRLFVFIQLATRKKRKRSRK